MMYDDGIKNLISAVCETGVEDYREIVKRTIKTGTVSDDDAATLRQLDKDMPEWLGKTEIDMTWEDIKKEVMKQCLRS